MERETLLPARLFLLAYDPKKQRLTNWSHLGTLLRAAVLAELAISGHIADQDGRVVVVGKPVIDDPVLGVVLAEIAESKKPRKWQDWAGRRTGACLKLVREQLAAEHVIRADRHRLLGVFPYWKITLRDTRARHRFAESARRALRGGEQVDRVDVRDAAVVALAAYGELRIVVSRADRRQFKRRIETLGERVGPVVKGLKKAIQAQQSAAAAG
ncbi:GOLPH3/VPS74 family protein [Cryptosporangium aurantiacum]|uniref:Golgi phosphoprotein 3 (GPP34) n=1 Tax=Cryptosporangium aurantiacum TaxID=134849 RepID=A0A1M7GZ36_9ACTN|nr:GPP34 family phosphoprotein [Cryptosporangium aurantiacum]SHM21642.1 Golgi phosphoprotein 3 (GPP34) [Cryptosporangium aurantiacum]